MGVPYSDMPPDALRQHFIKLIHGLGDAEKIAVEVGASLEVVQLCQAAMMTILAAENAFDNDRAEVGQRVKAVLEQLKQLQSDATESTT
jgi:prefoldin subunit 5